MPPRTGRAGRFCPRLRSGRGEAFANRYGNGTGSLIQGPRLAKPKFPVRIAAWLLGGPDGCLWRVAGFQLQVAGFSPFFDLTEK